MERSELPPTLVWFELRRNCFSCALLNATLVQQSVQMDESGESGGVVGRRKRNVGSQGFIF